MSSQIYLPSQGATALIFMRGDLTFRCVFAGAAAKRRHSADRSDPDSLVLNVPDTIKRPDGGRFFLCHEPYQDYIQLLKVGKESGVKSRHLKRMIFRQANPGFNRTRELRQTARKRLIFSLGKSPSFFFSFLLMIQHW